jgi:hypothetical protein
VGLKATDKVQLAPTANEVVQVFAVSRNEVALPPVKRKELMLTASTLVLLTVTVCAAEVEPTFVEVNVRLLGEIEIVAAAPVPVRGMACGEPSALSVAVRLAFSVPTAVGRKTIDSVQLAPALNDVWQVLPVNRKELALVPVTM